jgi:deazaflavin-dependent oxidoreductase (nitroreductase family)
MSTIEGHGRGAVHWFYWMRQWIHRTGRPGFIVRALNRIAAIQYSAGILSPTRAVTLEVTGRHAGHPVPFSVVIAEYHHERYLVSMLGNDANWVRNIRAADGRAVLCRGSREQVRLEEVEPADRAPILRRYLAVTPGARPYLPVDHHAPLAEFKRIATQFPVFRITPAPRVP